MVKIKEGYSLSCRNSCGKVNTDDIKIINVTVGLTILKQQGYCGSAMGV